jgi:RNA polymerase sigma factor (sigma-70 family)
VKADFWTLWEQHRPQLQSYAWRVMGAAQDVEDVIGRTMLHLLQSFDQIEGDPELVFKGRAFTCLKQRMVEHWRRTRRYSLYEFSDHLTYEIEGALATRLAVQRAIGQLPAEWRAVVEIDATGVSKEKGAAMLGIRTPAYKSRLYRARRKLAELLGEDVAA